MKRDGRSIPAPRLHLQKLHEPIVPVNLHVSFSHTSNNVGSNEPDRNLSISSSTMRYNLLPRLTCTDLI